MGYIVAGLAVVAAVLCIRFRKFDLLVCLTGAAGWVICAGMQMFYDVQMNMYPQLPLENGISDSACLEKIAALEPWVIGFGILFWIGVVWCIVNRILRLCRRKSESV